MSGILMCNDEPISGSPKVIDEVKDGDMHPVTSNAVNGALTNYQPKEWKIAGTATGTNPINLPSDFIELNVNVYIETANRVFKFHFIKEELGVNNLLCTIGWGYSSYNNYCEMKLNLNPRRLSLNGLAFDSTDYTSRAYVSIYYR